MATKQQSLFLKKLGQICTYNLHFLFRLPFKKSMDGGSDWRPPSTLLFLFLLCGVVIIYVNIFQINKINVATTFKTPASRNKEHPLTNDFNGFLIKTEGCRIPYMDPFDSSVLKYISKAEPLVCNKNKPSLIESNFTSIFILNTSLSAYGIEHLNDLKCCYSPFHRVEPSQSQSDNKISYSKCVQFSTSANIKHEFIRVTCTLNKTEVYKDFFSFVPIKSNLPKNSSNETLNILIIGLDAVSRLNLHRQMPETVKILNNIGAIELLGYNKVGDNTFPNLVPILTGLSVSEISHTCWPKTTSKFDKCNFLWKNYSENGYTTMFGEDSSWMGIFNYIKRGFKKQPTDYYWGPFNSISEAEIGNTKDLNAYLCIGSRPTYKVLLDYILRYTKTMAQNQRPHFSLFWGASLSHDFLNYPKLGDKSYANFFNELIKSDVLKNTVLIFLSDHGIRWGGIRYTLQGRLEERLPFLFIALPPKYREAYYQINANLNRNTRRLTTPFDLHETLKDLLHPSALNASLIRKRVNSRNGREKSYSLFEPIPTNRTCNSSGISSHWCSCQKSTVVNKNNAMVTRVVNFAVNYINKKLYGHAECAKLKLAEIVGADLHTDTLKDNNSYFEDFTVLFRTVPGDANFEATVRNYVDKNSNKNHSELMGTISRINLYGKQSACMTDYHLKLYCYCTI